MEILYSKAALFFFISLATVKTYKACDDETVKPNAFHSELCPFMKTDWKDCGAIHASNAAAPSGAYDVLVDGAYVKVYCDMTTQDGGWTVFQRRTNKTTDFHQTWHAYAVGFGDVSANHWIGNEIIYNLTSNRNCELRVELEDWEGATGHATYQDFSIDGGFDKYRLHIGAYSGDIGDSLPSYHNGKAFSTYDKDNDENGKFDCVREWGGAWWHSACGYSSLNGFYYQGPYNNVNVDQVNDGVRWDQWRNTPKYSYKKTAMMLRCSN